MRFDMPGDQLKGLTSGYEQILLIISSSTLVDTGRGRVGRNEGWAESGRRNTVSEGSTMFSKFEASKPMNESGSYAYIDENANIQRDIVQMVTDQPLI